jgi:hypothetical protein
MNRYRGRALRLTDNEFDAAPRTAGGFVDFYSYLSEAEVLRESLDLLRAHPHVAWAQRLNTGAGKLQYPNGDASRFIRFGFPGLSDIIGMLRDGRFLAVECKLRPKKPSDDQRAFLDAVTGANGMAFWVDDPRQIWAHLPLGPNGEKA